MTNKIAVGKKVKIVNSNSCFNGKTGIVFCKSNGNMWDITLDNSNISVYFQEKELQIIEDNIMKNTFKIGDKVKYKDGDNRIFRVYDIYSNTMVSLGLYDYPDIEQDNQTNINNIIKVG
jgi:hypothetical protein